MNKTQVLIVSNMFPSVYKPYAGVYVKNLYQKLDVSNQNEVTCYLLAMPRAYTGKLGAIVKYSKFLFRSLRYLFVKYQVVHLHFFFPLAAWVFLYKLLHPKTKVVATFHGTDINGHFNSSMTRKFGRLLAKPFDYFISVGDDLKVSAEKKLAIEVNAVIPAGVDQSIFSPSKSNNKLADKSYDLIFVGSFTNQKGIPELVSAINAIVDTSLNICFVGSGPQMSTLSLINNVHKVDVFQNLEQTQIAELYKKSKFLVLPSKLEAFGLVVTEALYCATPALVSRVGGLVMQVEEDLNGYYFDSVSADSIKDVIVRALSLPDAKYTQLSANAQCSNPEFSLKVVADKHINIYRELCREI